MKRHVDDLMPAYLNGTLGQDEHDRVEEHLAECEGCRSALAEWRPIADAMRSAFSGSDSISSGSLDRVWASIDGSSESRPRARRARPLAKNTEEEMISMSSHALSPTPYVGPKRISPFTWLASGLIMLLAMGSFAWFSMSSGSGNGPEPMPAVQLASNATPQETICPQPSTERGPSAMGTPATESALEIPDGPYEGGVHVRPEALPEGETADKNIVLAISQTVSELTACMNDGNAEATWALTTDDYERRFIEAGRDPSGVEARAIVPMVGPSQPDTPVPEIWKAIMLEDGRVGAEIHPVVATRSSSPAFYDYYIFVEQDEKWLIDEAAHVQGFAQVAVKVDDDGFDPNELTVPSQAAELVLTNEGTTVHSLVVPERGIRVEAKPDESVTVSLKGPAGTYEFSSDIPADESKGFTGTITFEDGAQSQATPIVLSPEAPVQTIGVPTASATIHMEAPEAYSPDRVAVFADRDVELMLVNDGKLAANFTIDELDISIDLESGERETIMINAPEGAYAFYSTIPGHTQVGMSGILFVEAESGQP